MSGSLIDYERAASLCGAGQHEYFAAVCVADDGTELLWLVSKSELASDHPRAGDPNQPHEKLGRLPREVRERLWLRCGQPCQKGRPCRARVGRPGAACHHHRDSPVSP